MKNIKITELNPFFRILDYLLAPFMFILNGFKFSLQETHVWHAYDVDGIFFKDYRGVKINGSDKKAKFAHDSTLGLYHMPIFGGLTKYVVLEVKNFKNHWHIAWKGTGFGQIHKLKITNNKIKLLTGRDGYLAFAIDDNGKFLPIKIIGYGEIGDGKYNGARLF